MRDRLPSFRGLEAFITTADTLSLRLAAGNLNISVSAVSRRIIALESELGVQLFVRGSRRLALTPAGKRYRDQLLPCLDIVRQATKAIGSHEAEDLAVLSVPSFMVGWILPRLDGFLSHYPATRIEFTSLRKRQLGHPDIVIEPRFDDSTEPDLQKLFSFVSTPMCRPELVDDHAVREPNDLARVFLIDLEAPGSAWATWFAQAGVSEAKLTKWLKFDSFPLMLSAVSRGLGVTLSAFFHHAADRSLVSPFEIASRIPGGVFIRPPSTYERRIVRAFREWLMDEVETCRHELPKWALEATGVTY